MKYDIIIILCPYKKLNGKFPEFLNGKYIGGQTRIDATVELSKENEKAIFILVGGYNQDDGVVGSDHYTKSQKTTDMNDYLLGKIAGQNRISIVNSLPSTKHNLVAIFKKYEKLRDDNLNIGLLTNTYHLPRALSWWEELINNENEFKEKKNQKNTIKGIIKNPIPIVAESIIGGDGRYKRYIEYISRLESELKGIMDLKTYKYDHTKGRFKHNYKCTHIKKEFFRIINQKKNALLTEREIEETDMGKLKIEFNQWAS